MNNSSNKKVKNENLLINICRYALAIVFIFSGFVKAVDPLGGTYKIEDYFVAFDGFFASLKPLAFYFAIALSSFELLLGLNLLFRIHLRRTAIFTLLFMLVMTPLTLYLALTNPVSDCGCFGDAIKLTNWQTFFKNIIILIPAVLLVIFTRKDKAVLLPHIEWSFVAVFIAVGVGVSVYGYRHLPLIDFLPYKTGTNIPEKMYVPKDAAVDKYETTFIYEKNGEQKEFTLENYPKDDSTWVFVDQKTRVISEGYKAPIHDLHITDANYEEITDQIIYSEGETWLLVMYDLNKTSEEGARAAQKIYDKYKNTSAKFYAVTASGENEIQAFRLKTGVTYPFCNADPITLKTMIRANPGLMLIRKSVIVGKWNWRDIE